MSKEQKLFHSTVTFTGLGEATIRDLTQEQAWAIQDVMRLIELKPPSYSENGMLLYHVTTSLADSSRATTVEGGFLSRLMRRFNAWMMGGVVVAACSLAGLGFAQEKLGPRAVAPIRVALTFEESEASRDFNEQLRVELNKLRRVAFVSEAVNFDIYITAGPIVAGEKTIGYASAAAVVVTGARDRPIRVMLTLGPTPAETARRTARRINEQFSKGGK
jgi:hypothetical protein